MRCHCYLIAGALLGFAVMLIVSVVAGIEKGGAFIGGTLLNMAVFGAMVSYVLQALSFILLRQKMPHIERPYRSPFGIPGAALTIVIAAVTLYYQLSDPVYRTGVYSSPAGTGCGSSISPPSGGTSWCCRRKKNSP